MRSIDTARAAHNEWAIKTGHLNFFDKIKMRLTHQRTIGKTLIGEQYMITADRPDSSYPVRYSVHEVKPSGQIVTIGQLMDHESAAAARDFAKSLLKLAENLPTNPIKPGYERATISSNIAALLKEGRSRSQAVAIALRSARLSYRKDHAKGQLPNHLKAKVKSSDHPRTPPYRR